MNQLSLVCFEGVALLFDMPDPDLTRRNLLISGGLLAAAAIPALGATPLAPPDKQPAKLDLPTMAERKVGYAIMGLGELALGQVMPAFALAKLSKPVALISGHPDKARRVADVYGINPKNIYSYDNMKAIAQNDEIEIIYNILPNHMHAEYTIRGLQTGKHVLCEKPMAPTVEDCQAMINEA
ncbi:MAG: gfo 2 [Phycisphaerales bacterium]|nr:gfo 2 [Phycisphaerales bacterium]